MFIAAAAYHRWFKAVQFRLALMEENRPRTSLAGLFIAMTAGCAVFAFWVVSPDQGEWNLVLTATAIALVAGLLTSRGMLIGMLLGAGFIAVSLAAFIEQDPSGLGPPEITIPIQLCVAVIPMAISAWLGGKLRGRLSTRQKQRPG